MIYAFSRVQKLFTCLFSLCASIDMYGFESISIAQGKDFLYLQKNFKTMYHGGQQSVRPLWASRLSCSVTDQPQKTDPEDSVSSRSYQVRVLLDEVSDTAPRAISAHKGVVCVPIEASKHVPKVYVGPVRVVFKGGYWYINRKKMAQKELYVKPTEGALVFNGKHYAGSLLLVADQHKGYIINRLDIEEYIYSVLFSENLPSWPLEVHKVLAVAARSYLMVKIFEADKKNKSFHIKNTNIHQTYNGLHDSVMLKKAVEQTRGLVLMHNKQPIIAMFDTCCGGVVPAHIEGVVDFEKAPYLARTYACTFCKKFRVFSWQATYNALEIKNILKKIKIFVPVVHDIKVTKRDKAGVVQEVVVTDGKKSYKLTGKQWYSLLSTVKSFCFSITKKEKSYVVTGRGYGHHFGLCQKGARALVDEGWNFKKILQFYYPGTTFMHLKER